jgi:methylphosphotriester-DNA--protein-cysteine methyltransferase
VRVLPTADDLRVVPDACTDVVWRRGEGTTVAGPDTTAKLVGLAPGDVLVGMRFLPGAGGGVLGVPLDELRDLRVDVAEVDRAFDVDGNMEPAEVVARFMSAALGRQADPLVAVAAHKVGQEDVGAVARDLGLSERQLRRRFHAAAGYGPKTLARVLRFRRFVDAIDRGHADLAALAFDAGYADQAHLTRETTRLAGLPPAAFIRARRRVLSPPM